MPSDIIINAILIIVALAVLELIKLIVRGGFSKISTAVTEANFRAVQVKMRDTYNEQILIRGEFEKLKQDISKCVSCEDFDEFKKECEGCQKTLPEKYVLYNRHKEDMAEIKKDNKEGLERIWNKIEELVKLYYED
jgi:hypothetical protein